VHPAGIKFGLSVGLLQLRGAEVVVSDQLLESVSAQARRRIKLGKRVPPTYIWDHVVNHGIRNVFEQTNAPRQEVVPFFTGLDRVLSETLMALAERAGMGRKIGREFLTGKAFWDEFGERIQKLELSQNMIEVRKLFFLECCNAVKFLCAEHDPDNARHADLLALFMFNLLDASGGLTILERLRTAKPRTHRGNGTWS
jgi:hypothetical protein